MNEPPPPRITIAQLAYLAVFGGFAFVYATRVINGSATKLDWVTLGVSVFLLAVTAYRVLREFGKPDA
jgi:membrane protein implicated in regulation of membrane protease activity